VDVNKRVDAMRGSALTLVLLVFVVLVYGCQSASEHAASVKQANEAGDRMTVGKVQREIRIGMTNAEVVEVLGSPNMVTTDERRRESWVYDKISTETAYSTSYGGVGALVLGGAIIGSGLAGGAAGGNYGSSAGARATTQRTLTVIIKFDETSKVRDFSYRSSSF
jgi:outer membrane protein assembly factor BamE (lipoprotein component of BamABCDE complex)